MVCCALLHAESPDPCKASYACMWLFLTREERSHLQVTVKASKGGLEALHGAAKAGELKVARNPRSLSALQDVGETAVSSKSEANWIDITSIPPHMWVKETLDFVRNVAELF